MTAQLRVNGPPPCVTEYCDSEEERQTDGEESVAQERKEANKQSGKAGKTKEREEGRERKKPERERVQIFFFVDR